MTITFSTLQEIIFNLQPTSLSLLMFLLPTYTTLPWNFHLCHHLSESSIITKDPTPHQG